MFFFNGKKHILEILLANCCQHLKTAKKGSFNFQFNTKLNSKMKIKPFMQNGRISFCHLIQCMINTRGFISPRGLYFIHFLK